MIISQLLQASSTTEHHATMYCWPALLPADDADHSTYALSLSTLTAIFQADLA